MIPAIQVRRLCKLQTPTSPLPHQSLVRVPGADQVLQALQALQTLQTDNQRQNKKKTQKLRPQNHHLHAPVGQTLVIQINLKIKFSKVPASVSNFSFHFSLRVLS